MLTCFSASKPESVAALLGYPYFTKYCARSLQSMVARVHHSRTLAGAAQTIGLSADNIAALPLLFGADFSQCQQF